MYQFSDRDTDGVQFVPFPPEMHSIDGMARRISSLWFSIEPIVTSYVSSQVCDRQSRDDIMQEIAAAVVASFDKYDSRRPFVIWVLGIARNQVGNHRRRSRRDRLVFDESTIDALTTAFASISIDELCKLELIKSGLEKLGDRDRRLCDLRYEEGLKPAAIAPLVGMSANGVSKVLQRIRVQLRNYIEFRINHADGAY